MQTSLWTTTTSTLDGSWYGHLNSWASRTSNLAIDTKSFFRIPVGCSPSEFDGKRERMKRKLAIDHLLVHDNPTLVGQEPGHSHKIAVLTLLRHDTQSQIRDLFTNKFLYWTAKFILIFFFLTPKWISFTDQREWWAAVHHEDPQRGHGHTLCPHEGRCWPKRASTGKERKKKKKKNFEIQQEKEKRKVKVKWHYLLELLDLLVLAGWGMKEMDRRICSSN